eukprot:CAMPEP_0201945168 /NCGR_PEP_ID=MMETSP0903-20130614/53764_1 /ASSEMBLY_ACC=CAM_ASM_000552 /TAXON_ID=420261 /ORGANISM="Thalassiosira antarctica, Strain CCMP982" /LENGTH=346 /DNA_ID=CAMNT_0048488227 /DNA_START=120 /DNA_END=1161 /DNA_ORIENTATION=-
MKLSLFFLSAAAMVNAATAQYNDGVDLGTAANYAIIAKTGISTVPTSAITGDIAVSPITVDAITGFDLVMDSSRTFSTSTQVTGQVYGPDYVSPTPSQLTTAVSDMETAYTDAAGRIVSDGNSNLYDGALGGQTLIPGVYTYDIGVGITATDLTFDGEGHVDAVFVIQTTGSVTQAANTNVILKRGAKAENIFWAVAGEVTVGAGAHMEGILLVKTAVTDGNSNLYDGALGGQTLIPGVYTYDIGVGITATDLTFDGEGHVDAVFVIQTTGSVTQAANTNVVLVNGAQANNIFWVVAGEVTVGAGAHMEGILLVKTAVKFITGSSLNGRILAQTAATLQMATIVEY